MQKFEEAKNFVFDSSEPGNRKVLVVENIKQGSLIYEESPLQTAVMSSHLNTVC